MNATTTNMPWAGTALTLETLKESLAAMPPEPFGEWMRQQGCPPELWTLYLPATPAVEGLPLPDYVMVSRSIDKPVFCARAAIRRF